MVIIEICLRVYENFQDKSIPYYKKIVKTEHNVP